MKIFAGFFVFFITIVLGEIYDCETNKTVNLKLNEISFFETTNFPKLMTKKEFKLCSLKFDYVGKKTAKYELIVSYAEIGFTPGKKPDYNTVSDTYSKSAYHLKSSSSHKYIGQQGYIIFIKRTKTCRLESITRKKPFEFKNEKQMFYFQSDVHTNEYARPPCEWNFLAPLGYGFKIIIEDIAASVTIRNTTDLLVKFYGYVTIVKEAPKKIDERNVDVVRYHPDEFNFVILEQSEIDLSSSDVEFILNSYSNGSERNVLWEFESDGSVQGFGFKISFNELCKEFSG
uniref:Uncharacterized protein n=1 Tax=Panagrolaimus davidi TaxID=227884 RepID=A0A914PEC5_9BILA